MQANINGPKFSVVIATYNQRQFVLETIASVVGQSYPPHEIIVVVDGSSDGSADAIATTFPQVHLIVQENRGKCVARNAGIAAATGDWVCFLDHDDLWHKEKLGVVAEYITSHPDCSAVTHPCWFFGPEDGPEACFGMKRDFVATTLEQCHNVVAKGDPSTNDMQYMNMNGDSFALLLERNRGGLSGSCVRRDLLIRAGCFSPMQSNGEDWTMFINVARLCEWHTVQRRLCFYRFHAGQDTQTFTDGGVVILAGLASAWYMGRPLKQATTGLSFIPELERYGSAYRITIQHCLWRALLLGRFRVANLIRTFGRLLLPRTQDWLYVHVPPQLTWRFERYVLGMHGHN